jgi:hypothetical protein
VADNLKLQLTFTAKGGSQVVGDLKALEARLAETKRREEELNKVASELEKHFGVSAQEAAVLARELEQISLAKATAEALEFSTSLDGVARQVQGIATQIQQFFQGTLGISQQFEQFNARLETTLGGTAAADRAFARIENFTATTPFQLDEVTDSFINLRNRGIDPTDEVLRQLGDLAASQSKSLGQLTEAVLDAQQGEFERLKEFGVRASSEGDKVTIAFQGINQTVAKTPDAIAGAIFALGDMQGVAGGMAKQSATLSGQFSNLEDATTSAKREFGDFAANGIKPMVAAAIALLNTFNNLPEPLKLVIVSTTALAGALTAAVAALTAFQLAGGKVAVTAAIENVALAKNTVITAANSAVKRSAAAIEIAFALATNQATAAQTAQAAALGATALKMGLLAAAAGSIALVANSFIQLEEVAAPAREGVKQIQAALSDLDEANARVAKSSGEAAESIAAAAARNKQAIEDSLSLDQKILDIPRQGLSNLQDALGGVGKGFVDFRTSGEIATEKVGAGFDNVALAASSVFPEAAKVAVALEKGSDVAKESIDKTKDAIDAAIAALEAQQPVQEEDIQQKIAQIDKLQDYKNRIEEAIKAQEEQKDSLEKLTKELKTNADAYQSNLQALEAERLNAELTRLQAGDTEEDRAQKLKDEEKYYTDRIAINQSRISELKGILERETASPEVIEDTQKEITQIEQKILQDRIAIARQALGERQRLEQEAVKQREEQAREEAEALRENRDLERLATEQEFGEAKRREEEAFRNEQQAQAQAFRAEQQSEAELFQRSQQEEERAFKSQLQEAEEAFNEDQRNTEEAFQERLKAEEEAFKQQQRDADRVFQRAQQAEQKAFQKSQQAAEKAFRREQDAAREKAETGFERRRLEIERKLQLEDADSPEERRALQEQFKEEDREAKRRERAFAPLDKDVQAFQERQAAEAEAFQAQQQAEQEALQEQQRLEEEAFRAAQRQEELAFEAAQREQEKLFAAELAEIQKAFRAELQAVELEFQEQQRAAEKAFKEEQQINDRAFQEQQRAIERAFQEQQRATEAAFKAEQRRLDKQNAQEIAAILAAARSRAAARKDGGPVLPGQPYLVGEEGPELIVPRRSGFVLTAGQTAALMQRPGLPMASIGQVGGSDRQILQELQRLNALVSRRDRPTSPATYNIINEGDPYAKAIELSQAHTRAMIRSRGL